jgi:hypothetical protein
MKGFWETSFIFMDLKTLSAIGIASWPEIQSTASAPDGKGNDGLRNHFDLFLLQPKLVERKTSAYWKIILKIVSSTMS